MTGWLPVYHHLNKMMKVQQKCPLCQNNETIAHLFQCHNRQQWQNNFQKHLQQQIQKQHTPQELITTITTKLHSIINDNYQHQHFKHFTIFAGLIPKEWTNTIRTYNNQMQTKRWTTQISKWFIQQGHELWTQRNTFIHDKEDQQSTIHQVLNEKIDHIYSLQNEVNYHDQDIFQTPIEERYKLHEHSKRVWIEETMKTIHQCMYEHRQKMTNGQKDIRTYFKKDKKQGKAQ